MRPTWDQYFINFCHLTKTRSLDEETKVGCVIVDKHNRIVSTGYNSFPPGMDDDNLPKHRPEKYPYMVHAEINAILSSQRSLEGCTLYCTHSPCNDCSKAIIASRIKKVVYENLYLKTPLLDETVCFRHTIELLEKANIEVVRFLF